MAGTAITITLYDAETNEVKQEYTRMFVPWKLLKAAVRLSKSLDMNNLSEEMVDSLAGLVVEVFGNKFSVDDLNQGADIGEMITVLNQVIAKAKGNLNPI